MRPIALAVSTLLFGCAPPVSESIPRPVLEIAGRAPGPPPRCVPLEPTATLRVVDSHHLVYGSGRTIWLSGTECPGARRDDILVLHPMGSQHCRGDIVRTVGHAGAIAGASCVLGDFVPYRLPSR